MSKDKEQENRERVSYLPGLGFFGVPGLAAVVLVKQIGSGALWDLDHLLGVLVLGLVVVSLPATWFRIRKERTQLINAIANRNDDEIRIEIPKAVKKSVNSILGFVSSDILLVCIAFLNVAKH